MTAEPDFYIGYDTPVPPRSRPLVFGAVAVALAAVVLSAILLVSSQRTFARSSFAFGTRTPFTGLVRFDPYPTLDLGAERVLLAGAGKRGADALMRPFADRGVSLEGALIERDGRRMVEVAAGSVVVVPNAPTVDGSATAALGDRTIEGEIVDGKCFLGVMNPGEGTVHRDCAVACIRGGLPPLLAVRTTDGRLVLILLTDASGGPLNAVAAPLAGRPVAVTGAFERRERGDHWILRARTVTPLGQRP